MTIGIHGSGESGGGGQTDAEARAEQTVSRTFDANSQTLVLELNGAMGAGFALGSPTGTGSYAVEQSFDGGTTYSRTGAINTQSDIVMVPGSETGLVDPVAGSYSIFVDPGATHVRLRTYAASGLSQTAVLTATYVPGDALAHAMGAYLRKAPRIAIQIGGGATLDGEFNPVKASNADADENVVGLVVRQIQGVTTIGAAVPRMVQLFGGRDGSNTSQFAQIRAAQPATDVNGVVVRQAGELPAGTQLLGAVRLSDGTDIADILDLANSNPVAVAIVDGSGTQITSFGGGTQYTEDAGAAADPVGTAQILVRQDTPATLVTTDGDNVARRGTNYGAAYTQIVTSAGAFVDTFGGGTQYTEGDTDATITGTAMMMEGAANALVPAQGTVADGLLVNLGSNNDVISTVATLLPDTTTSASVAASATADYTIASMGSVGISITGTWTGQLFFRASLDGTNWGSLFVTDDLGVVSDNIDGSDFNGVYYANVAGFQQIRFDRTSGGTGTAVILARANQSAHPSFYSTVSGTVSANISTPVGAGISSAAVRTVDALASVSTVTAVADNAATTQLLASNANRRGASIFNDSSATLYVKLGTTASTTDYTAKVVTNALYEVPFWYSGRIDGIWASDPGDGAARITEIT